MSETTETCEALKIALRQTKDGVAVTFLLHPQEVPRGLTLAPLGQRYALAMAQIDDDETLKPLTEGYQPTGRAAKATLRTPPSGGSSVMRPCAEQLKPKPKEEFKPLSDAPKTTGSVQRAAIMCSDARFQKFLAETNSAWNIMNQGTPTERAAMLVRTYCGVKSRREIVPGSPAYEKWNKLVGSYENWLRT